MIISEAQHISERFGFKGDVSVVRDMCKVFTPKGQICIKKVGYGIDRLIFIHNAKEYLVKNGFIYIDRFYLSPEGNPYIVFNDEIFVAIDWINGKECDFKKQEDVKITTETLANFHNGIEGYLPPAGIKLRDELGQLPSTLTKRSEELLRLKKVAQKSRNRFDFLFIDNVDFFIERSYSSIEIIYSPAYLKIVQKAKEKREYCHRDYSFHNLTFDGSENLHLQNFDYLCSEVRIYDIASFLRKIMGEYNWNVDIALQVLNWYDTISKIDNEEMDVLIALMEFPQKFWRIANRYYNSRRTRPENGFYNKLMDVVKEKEVYRDFITKFKSQVGLRV
ncbi:MAG: CotS family spore coat protein [Deltaproteobacteria bacterium]